MAHVLLDRAKVVATSMSGNTENYTLTNAPPTGFVDFTGVGDGNTTFYVAENDTGLFEIGIGTFTLSTQVLARTDGNVILSSNAGNNNRVSWPSNSTPTVFISQPADRVGVFSSSIGNTQTIKGVHAGLSGSGDPSISLVGDDTNTSCHIDFSHDASIDYDARIILVGTEDLYIKSHGNENMAIFKADEGVTLYYDNVQKLKTISSGIRVQDDSDNSNLNPTIQLYRNSSDPANSDNMGNLLFKGWSSDGAGGRTSEVDYGRIYSTGTNVTDGSENGKLTFQVSHNGALQARMDLRGQARTRFLNQDVELSNGVDLIFEGATGNAHETTLTVTNPTQDNTITFPDTSGTVALTSDLSSGITTGKAIAMAMVFG